MAQQNGKKKYKQPIMSSTLSRFMSHWKSYEGIYVRIANTNYSNNLVKIMMVGVTNSLFVRDSRTNRTLVRAKGGPFC